MSSIGNVSRRSLLTTGGLAGLGTLAAGVASARDAQADDGTSGVKSSGTGVKYTLNFQNNSTMAGSACLYQTDPDLNNPKVLSLAWFTKYAFPTTGVKFNWSIDYGFTWSRTGDLVPGVTYDAEQDWTADLSATNQVTFDYDPTNDAFTLKNQVQGPTAGTLTIKQTGNIPPNVAAVGISMSGAGTFAVQSQPNITANFTPHPKYWIVFGTFKAGEVLDIGQLSNPREVVFPPNIYSMSAVLDASNNWTISSTLSANKIARR